MNFLQQFQTIVRQHPDRPALIDCDGQRSTTYGQLADLSARIASKLLRSAAQPDGGCLDSLSGRAVLVCMDRRMEYIAAEIGILMAGGAFVPVLPEYPAERLDYIEKDCQAAARIDTDWISDIEGYEPAAAREIPDDGRAMLIYTSGSTGRPKGIIHTMAGLSEGGPEEPSGISCR